ncbi:Protein-export membrane protein SecF [Streptomyces fumanus]
MSWPPVRQDGVRRPEREYEKVAAPKKGRNASAQSKPGRSLALILIAIVALTGGMFASGHNTPRLGIDLAGGTSITLRAVAEPGQESAINKTNMDTAVEIMERRVNGLGVSEAEVQTQGDKNIIVNIPKGTNSREARDQVGTTAKLYFRPVLTTEISGADATASPSPSASSSAWSARGTPGTVIGLLTILGYSLYDTVVVFDSLKEQTRDITKQTRWTYAEIANRSINSTLVRSINTTVVALLPVAGLLFIGGGVLGAGMLNDISLSLFVGLAAGAYSSIFIATPLVADLKEREPQMKALKKRVLAKRAQAAAKGDSLESADETGEAHGEEPEDTATVVVGPRNQPASRTRGRGRPSGKRR